jgi:hypothetical protein
MGMMVGLNGAQHIQERGLVKNDVQDAHAWTAVAK